MQSLSTATWLILLLFALLAPAAADDSEPFDCRPSIGGVQYDLTSLGGVQTARRERPSPPTTYIDEVRFNLCGELPPAGHREDEDQCPSGTSACLVETNWKGSADRVTAVIPLASSTSAVKVSALPSQDGIEILFSGGSYPPDSSYSVLQSFKVRIACKENPSEPEIVSYVNGDLVVELDSVLVCKNNQEPPPKEGEKKEGDETPGEPADAPIKHVGSGLGFFFLMLFLALCAYFVLGAYYNYSTYGARGLDLIPHRDFWREVPYMLQDVVNHLCSSVRPRRSSRGGYIAM